MASLGRWIASGGEYTSALLWPACLTNLRVVRDEESASGWKPRGWSFPGWETVVEWKLSVLAELRKTSRRPHVPQELVAGHAEDTVDQQPSVASIDEDRFALRIVVAKALERPEVL